MTATYPRTPPLLDLKNTDGLCDLTVFKIQKFIETQPKIFASEEMEMVMRIVEDIREILDDTAQAKTKSPELPSLEEERAAHEAMLAKQAQEQKEEEERKRQEEAHEKRRMMEEMIQQQLDKGKKRRPKSGGLIIPVISPGGHASVSAGEVVFDQPCKYRDKAGNEVEMWSVSDKTEYCKGTVSTVYAVRADVSSTVDCSLLALKQTEIAPDNKQHSSNTVKAHIQALEAQLEKVKNILPHRNVLELINFRVDRGPSEKDPIGAPVWRISVLTPLADKGSLEELLDIAGRLDISRVRSWTTDLLSGLEYLHNNGCVHRDIHARNILLVKEPSGSVVPKIAEAGYEREMLSVCTKKQTLAATYPPKSVSWFPPEIASISTPHYTTKTDIWEFGIVFLQMTFGLDVFQRHQSPSSLLEGLALSVALRELVNKFFKADPKKRPRAFELSSSEFLATDAPVLEEMPPSMAYATSVDSFPQPLALMLSRKDSTTRRPVISRYLEDYVEEAQLGKGGFGEVAKARKKLDGQLYAIKKITQKSQVSLTEILKEVRLLSQLSHPAVVRYYNTWLEEAPGLWDSESEMSTKDPGWEDSTSTISNSNNIQFSTTTGGLDYISSSGYPHVEFGYDTYEEENGDDEEEGKDESQFDEDNSLKGDFSSDVAGSRIPGQPTCRGHQKPLRTTMYIAMEYCEKRVCSHLD